MNINSEYIQKKEFHTVFKGYNMEEVDKFLDILAVEFERLLKKNKELQDNLDKAKYEGEIETQDTETDVSKLVSEVLISAHKVADEIKKKAEREAEEVVQNKRDAEENDLKILLKEKKDIEEKMKFASKFYSDFILRVKDIVNDFNSKIKNIEDEFKTEGTKGNLQINTVREENTKQDFKESSRTPGYNISDNRTEINETAERYNKISEEAKNEVNPELKKFTNDAEEQKIREIIESKDFEETDKKNTLREVKKDKKIFDDFEEERIMKDRKKIDIGNPDIINEFFGNNDERKY